MKACRILMVLTVVALVVSVHSSPSVADTPASPNPLVREVLLFTSGTYHGTSDTEIYRVNLDGSDLVRLTNNSATDWCPIISPCGTKIAFCSYQVGISRGLYTMDMDGGSVTLVTDKACCPGGWSPDGTLIAFVANVDGSGVKMYTVKVATGDITPIPSVVGDHALDWSRDGTQLAFTNAPWALYVQNFDGSNRRMISSLSPRGPAWSPSGDRIAYEQYMGRLRIINADGTNDTRIPTARIAFNPRWSPDGTQIVYTTLWGANLRIIDADGTNDHVVPNVSGRWIDMMEWGIMRPLMLPIDIKPGSCPNPLDLNKKDDLPVAILGTESVDVTMIDPASVALISPEDPELYVAPLRWSTEDVATPYEPLIDKELDRFSCTKERQDGYVDLTLKFKTPEVVAALGDVGHGQVLALQFTGNLKQEFGGTPFVGEDVVWIRDE